MIFINKVRRALKSQAKWSLNPHFKFFAALALPWLIVILLYRISNSESLMKYGLSLHDNNTLLNFIFNNDEFGLFVAICAYLLIVSISFVCLNLIQHKATYKGGLRQSLTIFHNGGYFMGAVMIGILRWIWTLLWSILLIFPGIIKRYAYSQAQYIYKDAVDRGQHMKYRDAITQSRHLMSGHKWELFVLDLSFIGWSILSFFTFDLIDFWTMPYYQLTRVNFYQKLIKDQNK